MENPDAAATDVDDMPLGPPGSSPLSSTRRKINEVVTQDALFRQLSEQVGVISF